MIVKVPVLPALSLDLEMSVPDMSRAFSDTLHPTCDVRHTLTRPPNGQVSAAAALDHTSRRRLQTVSGSVQTRRESPRPDRRSRAHQLYQRPHVARFRAHRGGHAI